jgi:hypothetical protein
VVIANLGLDVLGTISIIVYLFFYSRNFVFWPSCCNLSAFIEQFVHSYEILIAIG